MPNRYAEQFSISPSEDAGPSYTSTASQEGAQGGNRYAAMYSNSSAPQSPKQAQSTQEPEPSTLSKVGQTMMDSIDGFNRQFSKITEGVLKMGTSAGAAVGVPGFSTLDKAVDQTWQQHQNEYQAAGERSPVATGIGSVAGMLGSAVAFGGPTTGAAASLPAKMLASGASSAGLAAAEYAPDMGTRFERGMSGAVLGAGMTGALSVAGSLMSALATKPGVSSYITQILNPGKAAEQDLAFNVKAALNSKAGATLSASQIGSQLDDAVKAADDLGIQNLSPAQAVGGLNSRLAAKEGSMVLDDAEAAVVGQSVGASTGIAKSRLKEAIDNIAPAGTQEVKDKLYAGLASSQLDDSVAANLMQNPEIAKRLELINKSGSSEFRGMPDNSLLKMDKVKDSLDDKLFNDSYALDVSNKMDPNIRAGLEETRKTLVDTLDSINPDYAAARQEAQKLILKDRYTEMLNKLPKKDGAEGSFDAVRDKLFGTPEKEQLFLKNIEMTGGNVEQAQQIIKVADQLYKNVLSKTTRRAGPSDGEYLQAVGGNLGMVQKMVNSIKGDKYQKAVLDLTIGGTQNWVGKVKNILSKEAGKSQELELLKTMAGEEAKQAPVRAAAVMGANVISPGQ